MKLIEVVVLMGAHCISPVEHTGTATEAAKVQCAVVIEKDTQSGTLRIVPAGSSRQPEVVAVLERLDAAPPAIKPAAVPPPAMTTSDPGIAPPPTPAAVPGKAAEASEPPAPAVQDKPKQAAKSPEKVKPVKSGTAKQVAKEEPKSRCRGEAKPKWYTNAEGRRKYRCVLPG